MIAIDAMGGDFAPHVVIKGAVAAAKRGVAVTLFGEVSVLETLLDRHEPTWRELPLLLETTSEIITMSDEPVRAVKTKKDSSLVRAVSAVAKGTHGAVVSAGNTGALFVASVLALGKEFGVERPAIAGLIPTQAGETVILDLGATVDSRPEHFESYYHLGRNHYETLFGKLPARIGILSNGTEDSKGNAAGKEAVKLLSKLPHFVGNVEPENVLSGDVDLLLCDGFVGNIFLKTLEATKWLNTVAVNHAREYAAAGLLLGVNGTVVVAHGASDERAIEQAILLAHRVISVNTKAREFENYYQA